MTGYIYAIRAGDRVKIGYSADPAVRFKHIKTDSPLPVRMMGVTAGSMRDEKDLHARFAEWRVHGEWFRLVGPVAEWVVMLDEMVPEAVQFESAELTADLPGRGGKLDAYLSAKRGRHGALAEAIGISKGSLSDIRSGRARPSFRIARAIEAATGGAVTMQDLAQVAA